MLRQSRRRTRLAAAIQAAQVNTVPPKNELKVTDVRAWALREPASKRAYSVVKIQTRSGIAGFGECAPLTGAEIAGAKKVLLGRPATAFEVCAPLLADFPSAQAGLNIAMLD